MRIERYLESTYLKLPEEAGVTPEENRLKVIDLVTEAINNNFLAVMIRSNHLTLAKKIIDHSNKNVILGTVINFPKGNDSIKNVVKDALEAISMGAEELDYVADYRSYMDKNFDKFDIVIIEGTRIGYDKNIPVKWIIETPALSDNQIAGIASRISYLVNKYFKPFVKNVYIKTCTGYYDGFGAKEEHVKLIKSSISGLEIKASGGIQNIHQCKCLIDAGASRIGTSKAFQILNENQ